MATNKQESIPPSCHNQINQQLDNLLAIGIALSAEKDRNKLLEMIISEARRITNADAGTLYLREKEQLKIKIIHNQTMNTFLGGKGEEVDLPPVPLALEYVSGYCAITGQSINIPDVYQAEGFDFSGPRKYDEMTGYHTKSMLVIPLRNHLEEIIGVLQLINALDTTDTQVIPFDTDYQNIIEALSSLAAIALTNMQLVGDIENLFQSFVQVMVTAIDAQTPYNASHSQQVSQLSLSLAKALNSCNEGPFAEENFDQDRLDELAMAGWLHDVGKIATPLSVMNKASRLDSHLEIVMMRIDLAIEQENSSSLRTQLKLIESEQQESATKELIAHQERLEKLRAAKELIVRADNPATFIDPELKEQLEALAQHSYQSSDGQRRSLLTAEELTCLTIPKGTLTDDERKIMEAHVEITDKMLAKMPFTKKYARVPLLAAMHHEHLDGKGYPCQLSGEKIPLEARILAIADIFDALTASDRPYKKGMPVTKALEIMGFMVKDGKLDKDLMELFASLV
ncbi:MAG: HD domain-containing phosphohydrolase [Bacillota bacterium]|nr:HD domain-containing phosphohydrolase [Bacillota bacterium]